MSKSEQSIKPLFANNNEIFWKIISHAPQSSFHSSLSIDTILYISYKVSKATLE